jgi:hypothetical protein
LIIVIEFFWRYDQAAPEDRGIDLSLSIPPRLRQSWPNNPSNVASKIHLSNSQFIMIKDDDKRW